MWLRTVQPLLIAAMILAGCDPVPGESPPSQDRRGVEPLPPETPARSSDFDPTQSTALFVGVRSFTHDKDLVPVPYAVDDAVDLAFLFALNSGTRLLEPGRVKLALSGEPQKAASRQRLDALIAQGASRESARLADLLRLLDDQARESGPDGVLIVVFATHGFNDPDGAHHLVAADSLLGHPQTALRTSKILDAIARAPAKRRLLFLDACRERLTLESRAAGVDSRSVASQRLADAIAEAQGQVIFFAAPNGGYAYNDHTRQNGVFTATVMEGLQCRAETDARGFVTVDTLATFVNEEVTQWLRDHGRRGAEEGIQVNLGGSARDLPLTSCFSVVPQGDQPVRVRVLDNFFNVFNEAGVRVWGGESAGRIIHAEVADLHGDGKNEVVVGVGAGGDDTGKVLVFGWDGKPLWTADTSAEPNYSGGHSGRLSVQAMVVADLFRQGSKQVVVLANDAQGWYQSRITIWEGDGTLRGSYWHPGHLHHVVVGAPTPEEPPRLIFAGINNDLRLYFKAEKNFGTVFMLDPASVYGEAPPYFGRAGQGPCLWYGVFLPPGQNVARLEILDYDRDGRQDLSFWTAAGHVYYADFGGRVFAGGRSDGATGESRFGLLRMTEE